MRFAPNPRFPGRLVEAEVIGRRADPRMPSRRSTQFSRGGAQGWLETRDDAGAVRGVRPSRCTLCGATPALGEI
ncbi:hypothetical protein ACFQ1E_17505 [Sphingomonas canadensis]|uniref:Uncharacterized protein n=1 Tax=Sphingomonas canadensis TaxID=1219257 RepID=A0ABW3H9P9_9SPHN|nr:hypothetical protein [Sphingomonas canadensis]